MNRLPSPPKRPILVWVICLFYFISSALGLFSLVILLLGGSGGVPEGQSHESVTVLDYSLSGLTVLLSLSGAVFLFILRRPALYLFAGAFLFDLLNCINQDVVENWLAEAGTSGIFMTVVSVGINLAVLLYVWRLWATKVLR